MNRLGYFAAAVALWAWSALAFANVPIGAVVENATLPTLSGGTQNLLDESNVSVFIFLKPGQAHSNAAMAEIVACEKELSGKPVHWCAIVSDRVAKADARNAINDTGLNMPVLIDQGDVLYGKFGVALHPVVGITGPDRKLAAYLPFAEVNYGTIISAQVRHALGEINDEELAEVLNPQAVTVDENTSLAHRYLRLAEKQFGSTNYDQALVNLGKSVEKNPTAPAYSLRGEILARQGKQAEAAAAFASALKLDPKDAVALTGLAAARNRIE